MRGGPKTLASWLENFPSAGSNERSVPCILSVYGVQTTISLGGIVNFQVAAFVAIGLLTEVGATGAQTTAPAMQRAVLAAPNAMPSRPAVPGDDRFAVADFDGAERAYRSLLKDGAQNSGAELGLARIALYRNELDDAERYAHALSADDPTDPRANVLLKAIGDRRDDGRNYRVAMTGEEVDVPFQIDPVPEIDALVNGKPAHLLLDTGGPGLDLTPAFAKALGVETQRGGEALFAGGRPGFFSIGHIDRLDLGGASIRSLPITVTEQPPISPGSRPGIDGVIGTKILYRFLSTIDYVNRRLVLRRKTASATFDAAAEARGAIILPMLLVPDHTIFARARVNDAPEALFNVDTGGPGIGVDVSKAEVAAAGVVPDASRAETILGGGGPTRILPFTANVTLGRRTMRQVPGIYLLDGDMHRIFPFRVAGAISQELFKRGALTFDFCAMKLIFDAPPEP